MHHLLIPEYPKVFVGDIVQVSLRKNLYFSSLRAKRGNPVLFTPPWIAASLRSSQ
jgi:hypothetical protein